MKGNGRHLKIVFAGGGTGGHIFPGIALAREFEKRNPGARILFFGTRRGLDTKLIPDYGYHLKLISVEAIMGKTFWGKIRSLAKIPEATLVSVFHLRKFDPDLVIGLGGYSSGPVLLAAFFLRIATVVLEPNSIPGFANRIAGKLARRIFVSFASAVPYFPRKRVVMAGNPLREEVLPPFPPPAERRNGFRLLVLGGSQGSRRINTSMVEALEYLSQEIPDLEILHQTGVADRDLIQRAYQEVGFPARVMSFIKDMAVAYSEAAVVIARAGATTLAELTAWGKPAILVPYPFAANQHQRENARELAEQGAAVIIEDNKLNEERLSGTILTLYRGQELRMEMGRNARKIARPRAREDIVDQCLQLVKST